jgi:putative DNA primase/helicase
MTGRLKATKLATVSPTPVEWLWPGRMPQRKLVVIGGDPGLGKSQLTMDLVARITAGKPWPDGSGSAVQGNALVLNAEDDAADTIRPRIDAMGGDPERVWVIDGVQDTSAEARHLSLQADLDQLREGIREHQAAIVVVDPLTAYLGGVDTLKDGAVRPVVTALNRLAMKERVTVIALIHLNKAQQMDALYRVSGSLAFISIPRVAYLIAQDPKDEERRVLAALKFNIGAAPSSLAYRVGAAGVVWEVEPCSLGAHQLLGEDKSARKPTKRDEARAFLLECLKDGPQPYVRVQSAAREHHINDKTLERAREDLGVESRRVGGLAGAGEWVWHLSPKNDNEVSSLAKPPSNLLLETKDDTPFGETSL